MHHIKDLSGNLIHCNCRIGKILDHCEFVTVSMIGNNKPYAVAVRFVHDSKTHKVERLYFLCDNTGPELGFISKNPEVFFNTCFIEMTSPSKAAFKPDPSFVIVSGEGTASVLTDKDKSTRVSSVIMQKYSSGKVGDSPVKLTDNGINDVPANKIANTIIVSIDISKIVGKKKASAFM